MKRTFIIYSVLACFSISAVAYDEPYAGPGPCNENYYHQCEGSQSTGWKCTCKLKLGEPVQTTHTGRVVVGINASDKLEVAATFDPEEGSDCEIDYSIKISDLDGQLLNAESDGPMRGTKRRALYRWSPRNAGAGPAWNEVRVVAQTSDCTITEALSLSFDLIIASGNSVNISYRTNIGTRVTFGTNPKSLAPILPPDSRRDLLDALEDDIGD